jgi:hypothetical protein
MGWPSGMCIVISKAVESAIFRSVAAHAGLPQRTSIGTRKCHTEARRSGTTVSLSNFNLPSETPKMRLPGVDKSRSRLAQESLPCP